MTQPIIICGGGIGGLATALALAKFGLPSIVLEQAPKFGEIGAGIQLAPNAFSVLDQLGVGQRARDNSVFIDELVMMDSHDGEMLVRLPVGEEFRARFGNPYAVAHRTDLHLSLLEGCEASPLITLKNSQRLVSFEEKGDGVVVTTASGETLSGSALIGADGINSVVRQAIVNDGPPIVSGHLTYRAVLPPSEIPEDLRWNAATLWAGPKTHIGHYPLRGWQLFNIVATFESGRTTQGANEPADRDEVLAQFSNVVPKIRQLMEVPREWRRWVLMDRDPVTNWTQGRVTLLGDAAHPMLQYYAQGACMALEDSLCIADKVHAAQGDLAAAFQAYQKARLVRTARVQMGSRLIGRYLFHPDGAERDVRNAVLRSQSPREFYDGFQWLYGGPDQAPSPGSMLAPLSNVTSMQSHRGAA